MLFYVKTHLYNKTRAKCLLNVHVVFFCFYLGGVCGGVGSDETAPLLLALFPLLDDATTAAAVVGCGVLLLDDVLVAVTVALVALPTVVVADWDDCCDFG